MESVWLRRRSRPKFRIKSGIRSTLTFPLPLWSYLSSQSRMTSGCRCTTWRVGSEPGFMSWKKNVVNIAIWWTRSANQVDFNHKSVDCHCDKLKVGKLQLLRSASNKSVQDQFQEQWISGHVYTIAQSIPSYHVETKSVTINSNPPLFRSPIAPRCSAKICWMLLIWPWYSSSDGPLFCPSAMLTSRWTGGTANEFCTQLDESLSQKHSSDHTSVVVARTLIRCKIVCRYRTSETSRFQTIYAIRL